MTRSARKLLLIGGALLALVLVALVLLPRLFGGRIADRVKSEANRALNAKVDWRDQSLGLFGDFPNLTLSLDQLTVVGVGKFEGDTLAAIRRLGVVLDLASAVRTALGGSGPVVVRAVELDRPRISLIKLEDGSANWDITRPDTAAAPARPAAGRPLAVSLRRLGIEDGSVAVDNRAGKLRASIAGFDQSLAGDFGNEQLTIETRAHADSVSVAFAGIPYLNRVRLDLSTDIAADLAKKRFTLKESGVRLNELTLAFSGSVASADDRLSLDLAFGAPKTEFRHILSLVPAVYARDFESVHTSGSLAVSGRVKGEYGEDAFPSLALDAKVENGTFRYPDLPLPARDIALDLAIANPGGDADSTTVNLRRFHVLLGRNPIDAVLAVRTPISDPDVDARVAGRLDLADLRRTLKLEGVQELAGTVAADAAVRTRMSWLDSANPQYDRIAARGTVDIAGVTVKSDSLPHPLTVRQASLRLAPRSAELRSFDATVGSSDLRLTGSLDNLLGFALRDEVLRGSATLASNRFNLDEWRSDEGELSVIPVPANLDFGFDATVNELLYDKLTLRNARGRLRVKDQRITLENFSFATLGGQFALNGFYETKDVARPTFDVGVRIQQLDIPRAFQAFTTVQTLAPVAKYARGTFSTDLKLSGALGKDMMPLFDALSGQGSLQTSQLQINDFPPLDRVASLTKLSLLDDPALVAVRSKFDVRDGRLHVQPFDVGLGGTTMRVSGSNGFDQSLDYDLNLQVPRGLLGAEANEAIAGVLAKAAGAGVNLQTASTLALAVKLGGTVTSPSVSLDVGAGSAAQTAGKAVQEAAEQKVAEVVDSAKLKAQAAAARLVADAEKRAASIRAEAQGLSAKVKGEGYAQADSLVARSEGPLAQAAAKLAADRLRKETDAKAARIVSEADQRANALVAEAKQKGAAAP
jgi:hypothetical protein